MKVSKHKVVRFHYSIKNSSGEILDSTFGEAPLEYVHGVDAIMEGLEKALEGKEEIAPLKYTFLQMTHMDPK